MLIVTCVYNQNYNDILRFSQNHNLELLVYNKNDTLTRNEEIIRIKTPMFTMIDIPNYGRCDYAFLYYIIKNYANLPDKVLFTKANFMDQQIQLDYSVTIADYDYIQMGKHIKYGIFNKSYDKTKLSHGAGVNKDDIEELFYTKEDKLDNSASFNSYLTRDFYNMTYSDKAVPDEAIIQFGHGPCMSVSKQLIISHPIETYMKLIDTFYPNKNHWTEWEGHTESDTEYHIGRRYHDNLLRFWTVLFIHNYSHGSIRTDNTNYVVYSNMKQ